MYREVRTFIEGLAAPQHLAGAVRSAAAKVRTFTGFTRVLIYRFDDQWNVAVRSRTATGPCRAT